MSRKIQLVVIITGFIFSVVSCSTMKPSTGGKAGKYYESFFTGKTGVQYFIKPIRIDSAEKNSFMECDIVFRINDNMDDSATMNISFYSQDVISKKPDVSFFTNGKAHSASFYQTFYQERVGKLVITRCSYKSYREDIYQFIKAPVDSIMISEGINTLETFYTPKKTAKKLVSIKNKLIF